MPLASGDHLGQSDLLFSDVHICPKAIFHYDAKMIWIILHLSALVYLVIAYATHTPDDECTTGKRSLGLKVTPLLIVASDHPF
jgi:hypothetical protein